MVKRNLLGSLHCVFNNDNKKKQKQPQVQQCTTNRNKEASEGGSTGKLCPSSKW